MPAAGSKRKRQASTAKAKDRKTKVGRGEEEDDDDAIVSRPSATLRKARGLRALWQEVYLVRSAMLNLGPDNTIEISDASYVELCDQIEVAEAAMRRSNDAEVEEEEEEEEEDGVGMLPSKRHHPNNISRSAADEEMKKALDPGLVAKIVKEAKAKVNWLLASVGGPSEKRKAAAEAENLRELVRGVEEE